MKISVELTDRPIKQGPAVVDPAIGAVVEFSGVVRGVEDGHPIEALDYEAYPGMAEKEIVRLLEELSEKHPCIGAQVIHRWGRIPVSETAIFIRIHAAHRREAFCLLAEFMDRLKQDVPIWKVGGKC